MLKSTYVTPIVEIQNSEYTSEIEEVSATFNFKAEEESREPPSMLAVS